jgi:hypothetical protein
MRHIIVILFAGSMFCNLCYDNYMVNLQAEQIRSINASLARFQAERVAREQSENAIKRDFGSTVQQMNRMHPDVQIVPQWIEK